MREVGAFEAKNKLGTLLDWVEKGAEVLITRHGNAVARLIFNTPAHDPGKITQEQHSPASAPHTHSNPLT
ncbi:MAG: type II toxin-antitoxin system prevent-host-death family antitoxin [Nitrosospira sp.]|nr:type II toxin-antitoxin system prevent-host-death family antitoxin [Nitrosospira sp.]MDN5935840.1 type II toxin-antitoxin system prevent-host-death family antitoxin [Nitrosospira sp.]